MYLGRVVGIGCLPDETDFIAYAVSGRSESSRARKARIIEEPGTRKVNIGPLDPGKLTEQQKEQAQWIFYNAIIFPEPYSTNIAFLASNGEQSDAMYRLLKDEELKLEGEGAMMAAMKVLGPERDEYRTPRIAAIRSRSNCLNSLCIVTGDGYFGKEIGKHGQPGKMSFVSTYRGGPDSSDVVVPKGEVKIPMGTLELQGKSAQELADNLYDSMDKDLVVCTAVATLNYNSDECGLAVRNLHN